MADPTFHGIIIPRDQAVGHMVTAFTVIATLF